MTRATWPLSRDAVEAAARALHQQLPQAFTTSDAQFEGGIAQWYRDTVVEVLRDAIAAWVPSEGQVEAFTDDLSRSPRKTASSDDLQAALLAAVRTEAGE